MTHDDQAADVLSRWLLDWMSGCSVGDQLDALTAAGLAVVKVGEPPPWVEPETVRCLTCGEFQALPSKRTTLGQFVHDYFCDNPRERTLYRLTEGNDR